MHKRGNTIKAIVTQEKVVVGDLEIDVKSVKPVELMLAALAYGIGIRYVDKTGQPYEIECEVEGYEVRCRAPCTGEEEKCLVYKTLTKGSLQFHCVKERPS